MPPLQSDVEDGLAPDDDGAAAHLVGCAMPSIVMRATSGGAVDLSTPSADRAVIFAYPLTGEPGVPMPQGWDVIPGAQGCTAEVCAFRDRHAELRAQGVMVYGLSTQTSSYQSAMARRLGLPFPVLSDERLQLTRTLRLPTFDIRQRSLLKRLTLVIRGGSIEHVFFPVFPADHAADDVLAWLAAHPSSEFCHA